MAPPTPPTPPDCPGPDTCEPAHSLNVRIGTLENSVRILAAGHVTLTEQMVELSISVARQDKRMDQFGAELAQNGKDTRETLQAALEIKDIVTTGRTMGKLAKWAAPTLVACAVAFGVIKGWAVDIGQALSAGQRK